MAEEIVIDIHPSGNITFEGKGFKGGDCKKLTRELEEAAGVVTETKLKPEFRQTTAKPRQVQR